MIYPGRPTALATAALLTFGVAAFAASGLDSAGIDRTTAPGDDFFRYANGAWIEATPIPPDRSSYGTGAMLTELTAQRTADLIRETAKSGAPAGSEVRKIGDYYASFMDEEGIEKRGLQPLQPALDRIASISDRSALARTLGGTLRADVDILNNTKLYTSHLLGLWVAQDLDDPGRYSAFLLQGGLGMPDRDYYLSPSPSMADIRARYQAHIAAVLKLAQLPDAEARAARIFDLEHRMAEVHWSRAESENVLKGNNHWSRKDFEQRAPGLDWQAYFAAAGLEQQAGFVVWQPSALTGLAALAASQPLESWKDYLLFHAITHASAYLPKAFVDEQFAFYGTVLSGTPQLRPRWKRGVDATNEALGDAIGKLYVRRYFPAAEKARAEAMARNLLAAFGTRIDRLEWMAPETKTKAKAKLATLKIAVGYPDTWRDYSALRIIRGDALGNAERGELFEYHHNLAKLGRSVDRSEWVMTPQTVNAVNLPAMNAINFPAAILQPPFFDPSRPASMDYGAIGATIGHEISHSFDDQGALFDASGRLRNWWTKEDFAHFEAAAARLAAQYDLYRPFPDLAVNGKQTLSENIADVAGLSVAYDAYKLALHGATAPPVANSTGDQLFFLSFAQSWRSKIREPALRQRIVTDGHAPAEYRADTVRNLDAWYAAFDVKAGQKLYLAPADRVRVW
jgi:putative endopeptidase